MNKYFRWSLMIGFSVLSLISCGQTPQIMGQTSSRQVMSCPNLRFGIQTTLTPELQDWQCIGRSKTSKEFIDTVYVGLHPFSGPLPGYTDVFGNRYAGTSVPNLQFVPDSFDFTGNNTQRIQLPEEKDDFWLQLTGHAGIPYTLHRVQETTNYGLEQRIGVHFQDLINGITPYYYNSDPVVFKQIQYQGLNTFYSEYKHTNYWMFQNNTSASMTLQMSGYAQWLSVGIFDANGNQVMELGGQDSGNTYGQMTIPLEQLEDGAYYFVRIQRSPENPAWWRQYFDYKILFN